MSSEIHLDLVLKPRVDALCGMLLVDKPEGLTSHAVVSYIRKTLHIDKVGHLGTLDPFASGLLPILIGGATRLSDEILSSQKQYLFTIQFGTETDTLDSCGQIVKQEKVPQDFEQKIKNILPNFLGEVEQVPPVYSALKMQGRPLYEYMRAVGKLPHSIETKKRKIQIHSMDFVHADPEKLQITLRTLCGKGTYIRALARDMAQAIGTVGFCSALRREWIDPQWSVSNAVGFLKDSRPSAETITQNLITPEKILPQTPKISLSEKHTKLLSSGNVCIVNRSELAIQKEFALPNSIFVTSQSEEVMYYGSAENLSAETVKICPKKKMY